MEILSNDGYSVIPGGTGDSMPREWAKKLPTLLRAVGAAAVVLSLYSFLVRGWDGSSDLVRYFILLGHTGLLGGIALASGHYLKEGKGARLLMMLALVSVPVNFAILGALLYSVLPLSELVEYPRFVAWTAESAGSALLVSGFAMMVLAPLSLVGFRSLARGISGRLTTLFMLSNAALLVPIRDPMLVSVVAIGLAAYILYSTTRTARQRSEAKTFEGLFTLLLQFLPVGILLGRNIWLYAPEAALLAAGSITAFMLLRQSVPLLPRGQGAKTLVEILSLGLALATGFNTMLALVAGHIGESAALVIGSIVAAAMVYEISLRDGVAAATYRVISIGIATAGLVLNLVLYGGVTASILTLGLGVAGIFTSYAVQQRALLIGSVVLVVAGMIDQYLSIYHLFNLGSWATLAIVGVVAILLASLLETRGDGIRQSIARWRASYSDWTY